MKAVERWTEERKMEEKAQMVGKGGDATGYRLSSGVRASK